MTKYLFVYHGGKIPDTAQARERAMDQWGKWYAGMGPAVVDGGNPVGKSTTVLSDGSVVANGGANPASGYTIVQAETLEAVVAMAKGCPIREGGGSIEIAPLIDM
ncbi:MAG: hypothetical protein AB7P21_21245 [Lautropia sp.]